MDADDHEEATPNREQRHYREEIHQRSGQNPGEQSADYFDNIDNIDVNIEETFNNNQQ